MFEMLKKIFSSGKQEVENDFNDIKENKEDYEDELL